VPGGCADRERTGAVLLSLLAPLLLTGVVLALTY
jgi:hypothetical protein